MRTSSLNRVIGVFAVMVFCWAVVAAVFVIAPPAYGETVPTQVSCRVVPDREVILAGKSGKVIVKVTLDAAQPRERTRRPPVNLAIVLDRSSSMSGDKLEKAKEAAIEALRRLGPRDKFSVVVYNHLVETVVPARSASDTEWIEPRIRSFQCREDIPISSAA